jgi:hypothetical protein
LINTDLCYSISGGSIIGINLLIPPHPYPLPQGEGIGGSPNTGEQGIEKFSINLFTNLQKDREIIKALIQKV